MMRDDPTEDGGLSAEELALADVLAGLEQGEPLEELLARHGDVEDVLRRRLEALRAVGLDRVGDPGRPVVPGFVFSELIGRGGMGEVWAARREDSDAPLALKIVRRTHLSPDLEARLSREAETLARLDHPAIVGLLDSGEHEGLRWLAMRYVPGRDLDSVLKQDRPGVREVVTYIRDAARALAVAHEAGVVHRDVKPKNIRVTPDGHVVLLDFGLTRGADPSSLSQTGGFVGTPHYAAPEQIRGEKHGVGPRADVYGLGVTLWEALAGRPPFAGSTAEALFYAILTEAPPDLRTLNDAVPRDLAAVVERAIEKDARDRYASVSDLATDLDAVLELRAVRMRRPHLRRRLVKAVRRRPWVTAASSAVVLIAIAAALTSLVRDVRESDRRREAARVEVRRAERLLDDWLEESRGLENRIVAFRREQSEFYSRFNAPDDVARFDREFRAMESARGRRELVFAAVADALRRADDLDREAEGHDRVLARLEAERFRLAHAAGDDVTAEYFADRVRALDPASVEELMPRVRVALATEPPGARVDLFAYRRHDRVVEGGEPRLVAVPLGRRDEPRAGTLAWLVRRGEGELQAQDLVLSMSPKGDRPRAGEAVTVWRDGRRFESVCTDGVVLRATKSPLWHGPNSLAGTTPLDISVPGDRLVALVRREGFEPVRVRLPTALGGQSGKPLRLLPVRTLPPDFIMTVDRHLRTAYYMDREVTVFEYTEFLLDRSVQDRVLRGEELLPLEWTIVDGGVVLPTGVTRDMPAHGMSWRAAVAYAEWRTEKARASGATYSLRLPDWSDWQASIRCDAMLRRFPWGDEFRAAYAKSCFSRSEPILEPVLSYPVDETMNGLFDVCGSVSEFGRGWFWEERLQRPISGGSWAFGMPLQMELEYVYGVLEDMRREHIGFRLELVFD